MDMSTSLRIKMAEKNHPVAEVASAVGRSKVTVTSWRTGKRPIPLKAAQELYALGYLHAEALLGEAAA